MSFSFVTPLIKQVRSLLGTFQSLFYNPIQPKLSTASQGTHNTLNEDDVWEVSPHHRAGPLLARYMTVKGKTLLRKLWTVNSLDLMYVIVCLSQVRTLSVRHY